MKFLSKFRGTIQKNTNINLDFAAPRVWYHTGNFALNKIMSGSYTCGVPQSRLTVLAGPSGSGKTFLACNLAREAQATGAFILYIDTENAIDPVFVTKIGVNVDENRFMRVGITTFADLLEVVSGFINGYVAENGRGNYDAPPVMIILDSIDMLLTETEMENFDKGDQKGDQGQRTKQIKAILRGITNKIANIPITFLATHQVYQNQDVKNGEGVWIVNNSVKYSASQIFLCTKLKLREETEVVGIRMRVEAYKTRFAKLGSKVEIDVPYAQGMNPYSYLLDLLETDGVITKGGAWNTVTVGEDTRKFMRKDLNPELFRFIMTHPKVAEQETVARDLMAQVTDEDFTIAGLSETDPEVMNE